MKASARKIIDLTEEDHDPQPSLQPSIDPLEPLADVAAVLRQARERRRVSLARAVEQTNIARQYLQALENGGSLEGFPAPVYARFFLAYYARFLGLDPGPLLRRLPQPRAHHPHPRVWLSPGGGGRGALIGDRSQTTHPSAGGVHRRQGDPRGVGALLGRSQERRGDGAPTDPARRQVGDPPRQKEP